MDKKTALKVLIENSTILNDEVKKVLLEKLELMGEADVDALGTLLAKEMEQNVEDSEEFRKIIENVKNR